MKDTGEDEKYITMPVKTSIRILSCLGLLTIVLLGGGCSSTRKTMRETPADRVVRTALEYRGTPYAYGGNDRRGMDCSGLVHLAIESEGIDFPRVSRQMAKEGRKISLAAAEAGDLLFFRTGRRNRISHVGLVTEVKKGEIFFIHATTRKGVIVSSLNEPYWSRAYRRIRRVLPLRGESANARRP